MNENKLNYKQLYERSKVSLDMSEIAINKYKETNVDE